MVAPYPEVFDTHAHVTMAEYDRDRDQVIERARREGVTFLEVGFDEDSSKKALDLASATGMLCAAGIHPHHSSGDPVFRWGEIERLALKNPKAVRALGEMGLDYYRMLVPAEVQRRCFREGLRLAQTLCLPVIIHQREAERDVLDLLAEADLTSPIVFHCFSQGEDYLRQCLALGGYLGIGGIVTYPKSENLRRLLRDVPQDRLLLETDCPYLSPEGHRGKRNEPAFVLRTLDVLAGALCAEPREIAALTTANAARVFV